MSSACAVTSALMPTVAIVVMCIMYEVAAAFTLPEGKPDIWIVVKYSQSSVLV